MKKYTIILFIFIIHLSIVVSAQENKNVLLISSYNSGFPTYFQQINGIKSILDSDVVNLDIEFMDSKRFTDLETYNLFYKTLKNKLSKSIKYNLVVVSDDDALNFVLQYENELFKNIPIVFLGVNNIEKATQQNSNPNVTGVVESVSMKETIELMIHLFPETGSIYCISDSTSSGLADLELYRQIAKQKPNTEFKEINLGQLSISEYKEKLRTISIKTPVLLLSAYHDKMQNTIDFKNIMNLFEENLNAPLFHLWEHGMGKGILGGKIISHFEQGKKAAEIAYKILNGIPVSTIKVLNKSPNVYMFDYNQLIKYDIPLNKLPHKSKIVNQPITFWMKNKQLILISLTILFVLIALIIILSRNIFKRKKFEEELKIQNAEILNLNNHLLSAKLKAEENEKKFKQLFYDHPAVKLLISLENGNIFDANEAAAKFYGWDIKKLSQMNISEINILPFSEIKTLWALARKNDVFNLEFKHVTSNGTIVDVEVFPSIINISGKQYFYLIIHDVGEKKKQEHRIRLLSRSVEQSPVAITITDKTGIIEYVNPAFTKISGYLFHEVIGKNSRILKSGKTTNKTYNEIWNTIGCGNTWEGEVQNKKANGEYYWLRTAISPIYEHNKLINFVSVSEDITEKRKIIEDLVVAKEKAQESDQLKSAFLANMSHEIRTPMNGILGFAGLLKESELSGEKQKKYIQIIEKSGKRMLNIINDIVSISRIESGIMDIHLCETNINNQLQFVYDSLKFDADCKKLKLSFTCDFPEKEAVIKMDSEKFFSILSNLIKNAIKYTDEGSIEYGYIHKEKEELLFYVKDTGIGISNEQKEVIFDRFIQADIKDKMARQGAGLGLAISKAYVEMLGGKIWVESEETKGSTFFFTIPTNINSKEDEQKLISEIQENETKPIISEISGLKALIAEDDEASQELIQLGLQKFSKEIYKASNGLEAIKICRKSPDIDLILMDIQMPKMNGYQATREIRKFNKKVIIIAQTAFALTGDKDKAIEAGCNDYLSKPIRQNELLALLKLYFTK